MQNETIEGRELRGSQVSFVANERVYGTEKQSEGRSGQ